MQYFQTAIDRRSLEPQVRVGTPSVHRERFQMRRYESGQTQERRSRVLSHRSVGEDGLRGETKAPAGL